MGPGHERRVVDQGGADRDGRKASGCHYVDTAHDAVGEADTDAPASDDTDGADSSC